MVYDNIKSKLYFDKKKTFTALDKVKLNKYGIA